MYKYISLSLFCLLAFSRCTEIGPIINPVDPGMEPDTSASGVKKVLIEEFTGVRCVNCPAGTAEVLRLQDIYGDRLIAVALHAGSFARPYSDSQEEFEIPETASLLNYLGSPLGYPTAVVNRKLFEGERDLQLSKSLWPPFVASEIDSTAVMEVQISTIFEESNRELRVDIGVLPFTRLELENLKLSVMLVEDKVEDVQLTPDGKQADYVHRHNLRDMLTAFNGNPLNNLLEAGVLVNRNYFYTIPGEWDVAECSIIAFVHLDAEEKTVLQVEKKKIQ